MTLQKKLAVIGGGIASLIVALLVFVGWSAGGKFGAIAQNEVQGLVEGDQGHTAVALVGLIKAQDDLLSRELNSDSAILWHVIRQKGAITQSGVETWKAVNQFTKESETVNLPRVTVGGEWLLHNGDFKQRTPIIDDVTDLTQSTVTYFQRMNSQGDMLRVATSVKKKDGNRAIGTYIPATNPDGKPNAVVKAVLAKQTYRGSAFVVNAWYQTIYDPVLDANGNVIGMAYCGVKQESVPSLRQAIQESKVGESGYAMVLGGKGDKQGQVMISPDNSLDGKSLYDARDADGKSYIKEIVDKAVALEPGQIGSTTYRLKEGKEIQTVVAHFTYYKPWDWILVTNGYKKDFAALGAKLQNGRSGMAETILAIGLIVVLLSGVAFWFWAKGITEPVCRMVTAAESIANGELAAMAVPEGKDEIGTLSRAFGRMQNYLGEVASTARRVADGDLTANFVPRGNKDVLGHALVEMLSSLRELVSHVALRARETSENSERLSGASSEVAIVATDIAESMQEIMNGAKEAAIRSGEIAEGNVRLAAAATAATQSMQELESGIIDVRTGSHQQQDATETAAKVAAMGGQAVKNAMESMDRIQERVVASSSAVKELGAKQDQIGSIVDVIGEIAEQTNLLALNAAIEAARAGESGRGFAVVADEVRKLAERSASATRQIQELIDTIRADVMEATKAMNESLNEVSDGARFSVAAREALSDIVASVDTVSGLAKANDETVRRVVSTTSKVADVIQSVAATSEETAAAADEVGTASKQMSDSTAQVSRSVQSQANTIKSLSKMAEGLRKEAEDLTRMVARFNLEEGVTLDEAA